MCRLALVMTLLCGLAAGCTEPQTTHSTSWFERLSAPSLGKDIIRLDVALLERRLGDPFLDKELWSCTDLQTVPLDQKAVLDDNGFRVGQIVGMPPAKLMALLNSERSCINPRIQLLPPGRAALQLLGPTLPHADFQVSEKEKTVDMAIDEAQFALEVVPTRTQDGQTRLRFTPKVLHGEKVQDLRPDPDGAGWIFDLSRPSKEFPRVAWEVTMAANEFLVVGASLGQPQSLAYRAFVQNDAAAPVQRLLVLVPRTGGSAENPGAPLEDITRSGQSAPLAEQATVSAVRAHGP
jgi:hypothetical protein